MIDHRGRSASPTRRTSRPRAGRYLAVLLFAVCVWPPAHADAFDLVRIDGVLGETKAAGSVAQLTLALGTRSIPLSVSSAQRISGPPASAPEIVSALGPGPPPIRVEGRDDVTKKLTDTPPGTRVTITGNLDTANAFLTLMEVGVPGSAGAK